MDEGVQRVRSGLRSACPIPVEFLHERLIARITEGRKMEGRKDERASKRSSLSVWPLLG